MSDIQLPPVPGLKTYTVIISGTLAVLIPQIANAIGFNMPAMDQATIQEWIGVVLSLGLLTHRIGLNTVAKYVVSNVGPVVESIIRAEIQRAIPDIVAQLSQITPPTISDANSPTPPASKN